MSVLRSMMTLTLLLTAGSVQAASIRLPDGAVLTTPGGMGYAIPAGSILKMPDPIPRPPTAPYDPRQVDTLDWIPLPPTAPFYDLWMPEPPTALTTTLRCRPRQRRPGCSIDAVSPSLLWSATNDALPAESHGAVPYGTARRLHGSPSPHAGCHAGCHAGHGGAVVGIVDDW